MATRSDQPGESGVRTTWTPRAKRWLAHGRLPIWVALVAVVLTLPSLGVGWVADDYYHRAVLHDAGAFGDIVSGPLDMFNFFDGDPVRTRRMMDLGFVPWWTNPQIQAGLWRPLTVLTHWLDYQLWPETPALMHAQSIAWFGLLVLVVAVFYRRMLGATWVAGLAALLYAVDDARGMPVAFLANRNVLISATFGVTALLMHDRWRRGGSGFAGVATAVLLLASLLAKEAGVATCAYLAAYALWCDGGSWKSRVLSLLPYALVVLGWRVVYAGLGYGMAHTGLYVDPLSEPLRFVYVVAVRGPVLLLGQWAWPPAEIVLLLSDVQRVVHWVVAVVVLGALGWLVWPVVRRDRVAWFWVTGMLLAVVPFCAAFPGDRLLTFVGLGAMGLLAQVAARVFESARGVSARLGMRWSRVVVGALLGLHLAVSPAMLMARSFSPTGDVLIGGFYLRLPFDERIRRQELIVVNPPSVLHMAYLLPERELAGERLPKRVLSLASGMQPVTVERIDERTLMVRPEGGYLRWLFDRLFREEGDALGVGDTVDLTGVKIRVNELNEAGRPAVVRFEFARSLDSPRYRWVCFEDGAFGECVPPAVGERWQIDPW